MTSTRSRFVDFAPSGSSITLTERDIAILQVLQEFPYLSLPYIAELLGYQKKLYVQGGKQIVRYPYLRVRLQQLRKDGGYVKCPAESWNAANSRYRPAVYALTPKGKAELKDRGLDQPTFKLGNDFAHDFGSCLVPASFKIGVIKSPSLRFIDAREIIDHGACPESTRNAQAPFSIPVHFAYLFKSGASHPIDTYKEHDWSPFGIGRKLDNGRERKIFFPGHEFDRSTEPLETDDTNRASMKRHLLSILALLGDGYKVHFGLPKVYVPIVTIGAVRMQSIMKLLLKLTDGKGSERILFKCVDDFSSFASFPPATGHMLTEPWERAAFPPFDILKAIEGTS